MTVEMVSPFGSGTAQVPDDLVERYRADGWALADTEPDKPKAKATTARSAKSTTTRAR